MAYTPPTKTIGDLRGIATVKFNSGKTKARIEFTDHAIYNRPFVLDEDELPAGLSKGGEYFITVSSDCSTIKNWRPVRGVYRGYFDKFVSKKDAKPTPMTYVGNGYESKYFIAIFKFASPKEFEECSAPVTLPYWYTDVYDEGKDKVLMGFENHPKSGKTAGFVAFNQACGTWDRGAIAWDAENVLAIIQRRLKNARKLVEWEMKDGWIMPETLHAVESPTEEPELEEEKEKSDNKPVEIADEHFE